MKHVHIFNKYNMRDRQTFWYQHFMYLVTKNYWCDDVEYCYTEHFLYQLPPLPRHQKRAA